MERPYPEAQGCVSPKKSLINKAFCRCCWAPCQVVHSKCPQQVALLLKAPSRASEDRRSWYKRRQDRNFNKSKGCSNKPSNLAQSLCSFCAPTMCAGERSGCGMEKVIFLMMNSLGNKFPKQNTRNNKIVRWTLGYILIQVQFLKAECFYAVFRVNIREAIAVQSGSVRRPHQKPLGPPVKQELQIDGGGGDTEGPEGLVSIIGEWPHIC